MTSSAVRSLPLWKVIPDLSRIVHSVAVAFGVTSSASTSTAWASGVRPTSGSYRLSTREKSALVIAASGSRVSAVDPPVIAARSVPPRRGGPLATGADDAAGAAEMPQPLSRPPAPAASDPATAIFTNSLRLRSIVRSRLRRRPSPVRASRHHPIMVHDMNNACIMW